MLLWGLDHLQKKQVYTIFRDPLLDTLAEDPDIDFQGVIVVGTPQDNRLKHLVGWRTATWLEAMRTDGAHNFS